MLQSRCKTFISQGDVPGSVRKDETVSEGNWRSPLSATNATGDAIPRDASLQLCFSSPLPQPSSLLFLCLCLCTADIYTAQFLPSDVILALSGVVAAGLQEWADPHLQACLHLFKLFPTSVLRSPQFLPVNDCEMLMQLIREAQGGGVYYKGRVRRGQEEVMGKNKVSSRRGEV